MLVIILVVMKNKKIIRINLKKENESVSNCLSQNIDLFHDSKGFWILIPNKDV